MASCRATALVLLLAAARHAEAVHGIISDIYSYGSPATASPALENLQSADGCFPGLRTFAEDIYGVHNEWRAVDAAANFNPHRHAKTAVLILNNGQDSEYYPCPSKGETLLPHRDAPLQVINWALHNSKNVYVPRMQDIVVKGEDLTYQEPFMAARYFVGFAFCSYQDVSTTKGAIYNYIPGWTLVAREVLQDGTDPDPVQIVQWQNPPEERAGHENDCALVLTGTNAGPEYAVNFDHFGGEFCGFSNVHRGYAKELRNQATALWPALRPKLAQCNRVICIGHSMGGSLCELLAACVNSKRVDDPDFQLLTWEVGTPAAMDELPGEPNLNI